MKKLPKILQLNSSAGVFGAERVILELAKGLSRVNFEPIVGVIENRNKFWAELATTANSSGFRSATFSCSKPFDLSTAFHIRRYIKNNRIDIVHAHGYKANFYALLGTKFSRTFCLATCHPWTETDYNFKARVYTWLDQHWLRGMDGIIAISGEVREQLLAGVQEHQIELIPNGIDTDRFDSRSRNTGLRTQLNIGDRDLVVGTIGRLVPEKGINLLLESAKNCSSKYSNLILLIIGDGPLRGELEQQVWTNGLQNVVRFLGVRRDIPELLSTMDVFVLPSTSEGLPMVILEAMAAGKAIVATTVGEIPGVIRHQTSGILAAPGNVTALSKAICAFLSDPEKRQRMAHNARKEVVAKYSASQMTQQYVNLYKHLLNAGNQVVTR